MKNIIAFFDELSCIIALPFIIELPLIVQLSFTAELSHNKNEYANWPSAGILQKNITAFFDELSFTIELPFIMELPFTIQLSFTIELPPMKNECANFPAFGRDF